MAKVKFIEEKDGGYTTKICPNCKMKIPPSYTHAYENEWCPNCGLNLDIVKQEQTK